MISCDLMDCIYDAKAIHAHSRASGHVPIIDSSPRKRTAALRLEKKAQCTAGFIPPERVRYRERSTVERVFGRLKDEFGARHVRVGARLSEGDVPSDVRHRGARRGSTAMADPINPAILGWSTELGDFKIRSLGGACNPHQSWSKFGRMELL